MKKHTLIFIAVQIVLCVSVTAQTLNIQHPARFSTKNQSLWGVDTNAVGLDLVFPLIPHMGFHPAPLSWNGIAVIASQSFGAAFTASTWAELGLTLNIRDENGRMNVNYETMVTLSMPSSFGRGQEVAIQTSFAPDANKCKIVPHSSEISLNLNLDAGFSAKLDVKACAFGCLDENFVDFEMDAEDFNIFSLTEDKLYIFDKDDSVTHSYGKFIGKDKSSALSLMMRIPGADSIVNQMSGKTLLGRCLPFIYDSLQLEIPKAISFLLEKKSKKTTDPVKKARYQKMSYFFGGLSAYKEKAGVRFSYTIFQAGISAATYHNRRYAFNPAMMTKMKFPVPVDYKVMNQDGSLLASGYESIVDFEVGNKLVFRFPCNQEFMDIESTYSIKDENNFNLHVYDSIALVFAVSALGLHISMNDITVIPRICVDIPYPCPTWSNPGKWCDKEVCTPAVVFNGFSTGFGPVFSYQLPLADFKYTWKEKSWSLKGFNTVQATSFRLIPRDYSVSVTTDDVTCFGSSNGHAFASVQNGALPLSYEWSNGVTQTSYLRTREVNNLGPGTHYVIVTDANGCTTFTGFTISQPLFPLDVSAGITQVDCYGSASGSINLTTAGGSPPYTYHWNGNQTTEDLTSVMAGTYHVTVTDSKGCTALRTFTVQQPYPLTIQLSSADIHCFGDHSGSAAALVSGGTGPYLYEWSTGSDQPEIFALAAGLYTVTVTDFNACRHEQSVLLTQPSAPLAAGVTTQHVSCFGEPDGHIQINPSGGSIPYLCKWFNSSGQILVQNATSLDSVFAGVYNVIITDIKGCSLDTLITVDQPEPVSWNIQVVDNLCFGYSQGAVTISISGGLPPYECLWSNGMSGTSLNNLPAGTYTVMIRDSNDCIHHSSATILQPASPVTGSVQPVPVLCFGDSSGKADLSPAGGVPPYTYQWSNASVNEDLQFVPAGQYVVTITDNNGCPALSGTVIDQPAGPLSVTLNITDPSCSGFSDGSIAVFAGGGTSPYYLRWDDTQYLLSNKGHVLNHLPAGAYAVVVSDANQCQSVSPVTLTAPDLLSTETSSTPVSCFNGSDGSIDLSVQGGTTPYYYVWSNSAVTEDVSGLISGAYTVTVTDSKNCIALVMVNVGTMPEIKAYPVIEPISCSDNSDGSIAVTMTGGDGNYNFLWSSGGMDEVISGLPAGAYSLVVSDGLGCAKYFEFNVPSSPLECISIPSMFTPNNDGRNDTWVIMNIFLYPRNIVKIFNRQGQCLFEASPYTSPWDGTRNGIRLPSGTYYYILNLNNGTAARSGTVTIIR